MENIIEIEKVNEVYYHIRNLNSSSSLELKEFLSCFIDNHFFHPLVRAKQWDGRISMFDTKNQTIPIGLFPQFVKFCEKFNYEYKLNFDKEDLVNDITDEDFETFYESIFNDSSYSPRDYQDEAIKKALRLKRGVIESPTACHSKGTNILMYDGSLKKIEDIIIGDMIMGNDGTSRKVLKLFNGIDEMYKITPSFSKSFIVNKNHILYLECTHKNPKDECAKEKQEITVGDYIKKSKSFKHIYKLTYNKTELIFDRKIETDIKLTPYFIGLYLGDGSTYNIAITSMDDEIYQEVIKQLALYGMDEKNIRKSTKIDNLVSTYNIHGITSFKMNENPIKNDFKKIGLFFEDSNIRTKCGDKFIPDIIKYGSIDDRYECLAGLIDTDGYTDKDYGYGITSKSERLIDDIVFIARSLGFFANKRIKYNKKYDRNYYRCSISGDVEKIPLRLKRKVISGKVKTYTDKHHIGFKIENIGNGEYYGFELDNNHLYLDENFLIHHNSGKSLVLYSIIRFLLGISEKKILLVVPNVNLVNQMFSDFVDYGWRDCESYTSLIYSKSKRVDLNKPIIISTWQSLIKKSEDFFDQFGTVIVDEVQTAQSFSVSKILKNCVSAEYKIGVTGTIPESLVSQFTIYGYLGPKIFSLASSELIERGVLSNIKIANIIIDYPKETIDKLWHDEDGNIKKVDYNDELNLIYGTPERNNIFKFIIDNIKKDDENILILCHKIDHLKSIRKYLDENFKDYNIHEIYGKTESEQREKIRQLAMINGRNIILASYGVLSLGWNLKRLHHIILASSTRSKTRLLQSIGRGLRTHDSKSHLVVWDIVDNLTFINNHANKEVKHLNHVYNHFIQRIQYYANQGFKYITKNINLKSINNN